MWFFENSMDEQGNLLVGRVAREQEKQIIVYRWLSEFRVLDTEITMRLLNISRRVTNRFLSGLVEKGFLKRDEIRGVYANREVYCLLRPGFEQWSNLEQTNLEYVNRSYILNSSMLIHTLCTQHCLLDLVAGAQGFRLSEAQAYGETNLPKDWERRPDAMIVTPANDATGNRSEVKVVCEFEMHRKSADRIYWIYQAHIDALRKGEYQGVYFFFPNDILMSRYTELFYKDIWPVVEQNKIAKTVKRIYRNSVLQTIDTREIKRLHEVFHFHVCSQEGIRKLV